MYVSGDNTSITLDRIFVTNNTAGEWEVGNPHHHGMENLKLSCCALFFTAARNGGGIVLFTPYDVQPDYNHCVHPPTYFTYYYQTTIRLSNSVLAGNSAPCLTCSGGGLHLDRGGQLILR